MKLLILNGPNLNMTGTREKNVYGTDTLASINVEIEEYCRSKNVKCTFFQSNGEGEIITKIHHTIGEYDGCVINAGAYTHYSYAIRDAISCVKDFVPFVEVHMSNIFEREAFRAVSVISDVCVAQISGYGKNSYMMGIDKLLCQNKKNT